MDLMLDVTYHLSPSWNAGENRRAADDQGAVGRHRGRDASRATSVPGNKGCVLIVDDDSAVRETLAELLDDVGFRALQAGDAAQALTILRQGETIDVLVTDLTMPGDDGISLIRQARSIRNNLPAVLLTGYAEQVTSVSTIAGGNIHVLRKPVQSGRLIQQIELLVTKPEA
jgi:DNA-binding NtrC family response regulator